MKQIERYIFIRIARLTIWSTLAITLLSLTTQILIRVDILTTSSSAIITFAKLAITLIPEVLLVVAPFALLVGIGRILTNMNDDSELIVLEAAGASSFSIAKPVLIFSLIVGLLTLITANIVGPKAKIELHATIANAKADILSLAISSGSFTAIEDGLYIQIAQALPGGAMGGIFLSDQRDADVELIYYAQSGTIQKADGADLLIMQDGEIQRKDRAAGQVSIVQFQSYTLDLSLFIPPSAQAQRRPNELSTSALLSPDVNSDFYQNNKGPFAMETHMRLSTWLYPMMFGIVLVAFLARARSHRHAGLRQISAAILICVVVRILGGAILEETKTEQWAPYAAYGLPILTSAYFLSFVLTGKTVGLPRFWNNLIDYLQDMMQRSKKTKNGTPTQAGTA